MEAFFLLSIAAVVIGAILAWFHTRTFLNLCIKTALATLVLLVLVMLIAKGLPEHYSLRYLLTGLVYFVYPYVIFLLIPSLATAGLTLLIRRKLRPKGATETPPVSRLKV
jgi:hypothetical protein